MTADSSTAGITHSGEDGGGSRNDANWAQVVRGGNEHDSISPVTEVVDRTPDPVTTPIVTQPESSDGVGDCNTGGVKKSSWNNTSAVFNGVVEGGNSPVMGAVSWPALSESTRPGVKSESSSKPYGAPMVYGQMTSQIADCVADKESLVLIVSKDNLIVPDCEKDDSEKELHELLLPNVNDLPVYPPSAIEFNFTTYFVPDFLKREHDQYIYRHPNGLCVIGLAAGHVAFKDEGGVTAVDFNVGKSNRSEIKVTGKRKRNAQHFDSNTALCKVCTNNTFYIVRCCIKGSLLEVNERLIKQPELLNSSADREGYIAIMMPRPADWLKNKDSFLTFDDYKKLRQL